MTTFAGWNMANIATGMISLFGMNVVVNHYFGTDVNAAMGIATQLSGVLMGLSANLIKAVTPVIVKSEGSNRHDQMLDYTYTSCKFSFLIFSIVCVPIIVYIKDILNLWLTIVPKWTAVLCIILLLSTLLEQLTVVLYQSIMAVGNIGRYNLARSITNIAPLGISIIMFQFGNYNPYWVFINWGIFKAIIGGAVNVFYATNLVGIVLSRYSNSIVFPSVYSMILSLLVYYLVLLLDFPWWISLLIGGILSIPIYYFVALSSLEQNKIKTLIKV